MIMAVNNMDGVLHISVHKNRLSSLAQLIAHPLLWVPDLLARNLGAEKVLHSGESHGPRQLALTNLKLDRFVTVRSCYDLILDYYCS